MKGIAVVEYRHDLRPHFDRLNRLWLEGSGLLEAADLEHLEAPEQHILEPGGQIFFAVQGSSVIGTCAAIRVSASVFELAKLSVDPLVRGNGLGRRLCQAVLTFAREAGADEIVLTSNTALVSAIRLYESLGFQHEPLPADLRYETANVFMRLRLRAAA
jgi:GNAT superfamily N-acetyltransferase